MTDEKIVGLFSRKPYTPPPEPPKDGEPLIDEDAVTILEEALQKAKAGEIRGVIVLGGIPDTHGNVDFASPHWSDAVFESEQTFIGGLHQTAFDIMRMSEADAFAELVSDD